MWPLVEKMVALLRLSGCPSPQDWPSVFVREPPERKSEREDPAAAVAPWGRDPGRAFRGREGAALRPQGRSTRPFRSAFFGWLYPQWEPPKGLREPPPQAPGGRQAWRRFPEPRPGELPPQTPSALTSAPGPWRGSRPQLRLPRLRPLLRPSPRRIWLVAAKGRQPGLLSREAQKGTRVFHRLNPRRHAAHLAWPSPPHLTVLGFLLQGSLLQPVHRVRGGGGEVVAAQAAPLLHLGAVVGGAVAHWWREERVSGRRPSPRAPLLRRDPNPRRRAGGLRPWVGSLPLASRGRWAQPRPPVLPAQGLVKFYSPQSRPFQILWPTPEGRYFFLFQPVFDFPPPLCSPRAKEWKKPKSEKEPLRLHVPFSTSSFLTQGRLGVDNDLAVGLAEKRGASDLRVPALVLTALWGSGTYVNREQKDLHSPLQTNN